MAGGFEAHTEKNSQGLYDHWATVNGQKIVKLDFDPMEPFICDEVLCWFVENEFPTRKYFESHTPITDDMIIETFLTDFDDSSLTTHERQVYNDVKQWAKKDLGIDVDDPDCEYHITELFTMYWNSKLT